MKIKSLKEKLKKWDQEQFDLDAYTGEVPREEETQLPDADMLRSVKKIEKAEMRAFTRAYPVVSFLLAVCICCFLFLTVLDLPTFGTADAPAHNEVMERYVEKGMEETGAVNTVAGVILDYRAFDTLGESHVLFTAFCAVLILLLFEDITHDEEKDMADRLMRQDTIVRKTATVITPIVFLTGLYIIFNGHLGPGGGFSGGAVIGAGLILYAVAFGFSGIEKFLNLRSFRIIVLCALCFYSLSKCYSFYCGANGLESGILPGVPGRIFSAGLILPLNIAVGIVVACTMYGIYSLFKRGKI